MTRAMEGFPVAERNHYRYNDTLGRETVHVYRGSQESLHRQESSWWTEKLNPTGSELLGWSLAGETTYKRTEQQLECSVATGNKEGCSEYFPLISYMTRFTTRRGLVPCLGTPCNELGYCPSLGLPVKSWNAVIQLMKLKRGMGSKFTLYCQLTPDCAAECVTFTQWVEAVLQMVALMGLSQIIPLRRILGEDIWFTSPHYWPKTPMGLPLRELSK